MRIGRLEQPDLPDGVLVVVFDRAIGVDLQIRLVLTGQFDGLFVFIEDRLPGGGNEVAVFIDHQRAAARQPRLVAILHGHEAFAEDGGIHIVGRLLEFTLAEIGIAGRIELAAAHGIEQRVFRAADVRSLGFDLALRLDFQLPLEPAGFGIRQVVGDDVLLVAGGHYAGRREVKTVNHAAPRSLPIRARSKTSASWR